MIANEKQYSIAKRNIKEFSDVLDELMKKDKSDLLNLIHINSVKAKIDDFKLEVHEYELLKKKELNKVKISTLTDLYKILIKARIGKGWTQSQLANAIGVSEQQVQRYESTNYLTSSLPRLDEIVEVLGINFSPITAQINQPIFDIPKEISPELLIRGQLALRARKSIVTQFD